MGLVCGCADKKKHPKEHPAYGQKFEGGAQFSDNNDSQMLNLSRRRKQDKIRRTIMYMHPDNPEFQKQMANKFTNMESYKKVMKQIKRRPELAPHFFMNARNLNGMLAGDASFDRLAIGYEPPSRSASVDDEPRESLMSPSLIDQIDFNQLGKSERGIQLPTQEREGRKRAFSNSSAGEGSSYLRYTFDSAMLRHSTDRERQRNFRPNLRNKNVSQIGLTLDNINSVWKRKHKYDHKARNEMQPVTFNIPNYFFKGRVLWTHQEYISVQRIQSQFRVYQLRKNIRKRIKRRLELLYHKKQLKKMMKKSLQQQIKKPVEPAAVQTEPAVQKDKSDDEVSIKSSELYAGQND